MAINPFVPRIKSSGDFNGGEKYRNLIDSISPEDANNIIEGLLYAFSNGGGGGKLYRHDIVLLATEANYLGEVYVTIINRDPTDYSKTSTISDGEIITPLDIEDFEFLPTHYIRASGVWGNSDGSDEFLIAAISRDSMGIQLKYTYSTSNQSLQGGYCEVMSLVAMEGAMEIEEIQDTVTEI